MNGKNQSVRCPAPLLLAVALLAQAGLATASELAGRWQVRAGTFQLNAQTSSAGLPGMPGSTVRYTSDTVPGLAITRFFNEHVALETYLAPPFGIDLLGGGSLSRAGKLGELRCSGPLLLAQWHWGEHSSRIRPYAGAGLSYAMFFHERPSASLVGGTVDFDVGNDFAPIGQLGVDVAVTRNWSLNLSALWLESTPTTRLSLPSGTLTSRTTVSAWVMTLTAGWRF